MNDRVHLWFVTLTDSAGPAEPFLSFLSAEERSRFDILPPDRGYEFLRTRAVLKSLLARYLGQPPCEIQIGTDPFGKPQIASPPDSGLRFNLSHTGDAMMAGFSRTGEIGVDIERRDRKADFRRIARRIFTRSEYAHFMAVPETARQEFSLTLWTRKEALLKAVGQGLVIPMNMLDVLGSSPVSVTCGRTFLTLPGGSDWYVYDIIPDSAYKGAYAVPSASAPEILFLRSDIDVVEGLSSVVG